MNDILNESDDSTEELRDEDPQNVESEVHSENNVEVDEDDVIPIANIMKRIIVNVTKTQDKDTQEKAKLVVDVDEEIETDEEHVVTVMKSMSSGERCTSQIPMKDNVTKKQKTPKGKFVTKIRMVESKVVEKKSLQRNLVQSSDSKTDGSKEYRKVYVRRKCVKFSPSIINYFLGRTKFAGSDKVPSINKIVKEITGTKTELNFGDYVFEKIMKHVDAFAVKLPITFPCLLTRIILNQQPEIVHLEKAQYKNAGPLKLDYMLFVGAHVSNIVVRRYQGQSVYGNSSPLSNSTRKDVLVELIEVSKFLHKTIRESTIRKKNMDELIKMMTKEKEV
ncbi:uncharacterized protein LOC131620197 [Vicia villosa]|uniref:uncharacterized protein LOC131620197 n=1 Tax=Vicia villosa TaxID=3911 RepID=UPI00273C1EF2|nr:uncharacterized protein LOC131620197 [Vicia villosa]